MKITAVTKDALGKLYNGSDFGIHPSTQRRLIESGLCIEKKRLVLSEKGRAQAKEVLPPRRAANYRVAQTIDVIADKGSVRIDSEGVTFYIRNGYGDGGHRVKLVDTEEIYGVDGLLNHANREFRYEASFDVKTAATIAYSDCSDEPAYELPPGKYAAYIIGNGDVYLFRDGSAS